MALSSTREFGKCMVFYGFDKLTNKPKLSIEKFVLPNRSEELSAGQVLLKLSLATVCGSDLHTLRGRRKEPVPWYFYKLKLINIIKLSFFPNIHQTFDKIFKI